MAYAAMEICRFQIVNVCDSRSLRVSTLGYLLSRLVADVLKEAYRFDQAECRTFDDDRPPGKVNQPWKRNG